MDKARLKKILVGDLSWRRLLRSSAFVYGFLLLFALFASDRLIFQPQTPSYEDTSEILHLESDGRAISAIHLVNPEAKYTVLFSHGNAEDLGDLRLLLEEYRQRGFSVFAYDYGGYGTSEGRPTSSGVCKDAEAALVYLVEHEKVPLDRIILHGRSVGGGPAIYLAEKYDVAGLIAESCFVTAFRVATHVPVLPFDKLRNIARIDDVECPVLVIHSRSDDVIPFWHGAALDEKAEEPKHCCWLDDATHNWMPAEERAKCWEAIDGFVASLDHGE